MLESIVKKIARRGAWNAKKKTIVQVLTPRCRQDGIPENGRFTPGEINRIISRAKSNVKELMPYFIEFDKLGNYLNEYGGLIDLAGALIVGFVTAAVVGYACIRWLLRFLTHRSLYIFAVYCLLFGFFCLVAAFFRG